MGYYIRVLGEKSNPISPSQIQQWLLDEGFVNIVVIAASGDDENWQQVLVKRKRGKELFTIERNIVAANSLGFEEIQEFVDEIESAKPVSAAKWLKGYLPKVKVIYAFQILFGNGKSDDWKILHTLQGKIWKTVGGILQADNEGFSNKNGYHILWQFSDHAKGMWNMAVRNIFGGWNKFQMDLGNLEHRKAFQEGKVPKRVKPVGRVGQ
ncbi:MAG: hypothetical protein BroJett001_33540 [Chloroflexota bacterium]|nr:MAG: hypothetical protein QY324_10150 [Anaerolineales bacterium]GIK11288.1 MAG: hypothetical protein BroJett001_33540 [Chloroflexota bacterium]